MLISFIPGLRSAIIILERICRGRPRSSAMDTWQGTLGAEMIRSAAKCRFVGTAEGLKVERYSDINVSSIVLWSDMIMSMIHTR